MVIWDTALEIPNFVKGTKNKIQHFIQYTYKKIKILNYNFVFNVILERLVNFYIFVVLVF